MKLSIVIIIALLILIFLFLHIKKLKSKSQIASGPSSKIANIQGYSIHYIQQGSGPHVVLLHGIGASIFTWRFLMEKLAAYYTVTAVDLLGFGASGKPRNFSYGLDDQCLVLDELFRRLGIEQVRLIGSSMGGAIALWYAKLHPQKVLESVVMSPALMPNVLPVDLHKLKFLGPVISPLVTRTFVRQLLRRVLTRPELITDETVEQYYAPYSNPDAVHSFIQSIGLLRDSRLPTELKSLKLPVLMIWGAQDKIVPIKIANEILKTLPQIKLATHPTAGHHPMEDEPDWVFEQVRAFFDMHIES